MTQAARPATMDEMGARMQRLMTPEETAKGGAFVPRPSDVIITPYGKSGTTWLQQIVHALRTGGDMDFDDISRVVPWIETSAALGIDLDAEQKANPRAFKSHLNYHLIPKGCRYIVSVRDPGDALVSLYRFFEGWFFEPGTISIDEFARTRFLDREAAGGPEGGDYWTHFNSWWEQRDNPNVQLFAFEHMKTDLRGTVERVAEFLEIPLDPALREITERHASLDFMLEHKDRFDDFMMRSLSESRCDLPQGSDSAKVRVGQVGAHRVELSDEIRAELDTAWKETVLPVHGLASYQEALDRLAAESS